MPTSRHILLMLAGTGALAVSFLLDAPLRGWIEAHQHAAWFSAAVAVSRFGAWHWLMALCAVIMGALWVGGRLELARALVALLVAGSLAGLCADLLRSATGRTRPVAKTAQGWHGAYSDGQWWIARWEYNSFPSGHTSVATAMAVSLFLIDRRLGFAAAIPAGAIAASRMYVGAHHFSDIVGGVLLGVGIACLVRSRLVPHERT